MKAQLNRLAERASEEGLLDVAYTSADSPFGPLLLATTPKGLVRVGLPVIRDFTAKYPPAAPESPDKKGKKKKK